MSDSSDSSRLRFAASLAVVTLAWVLMFGLLFSLIGYTSYLDHKGNQKACHDTYGPNSTAISETDAGGSVVCHVDGEVKLARDQPGEASYFDYLAGPAIHGYGGEAA